ncbi:peptidylprolyl isomerase [Gemmatimonas aurantiaca]|nr:peptidylprolyl isomerase [Gemmatimonas aurantiaca]
MVSIKSLQKFRGSVALLAILVFSSCSSVEDRVAQEQITHNTKLAQIIYAEDIRTVTDTLIILCGDDDSDIRKRAYRAIGRIGTDDLSFDSAVSLLFFGMDDSSLAVASEAAFALGLLGKDSALANRLVEKSFTAPETVALSVIVSAGRAGDSTSGSLSQKLLILLNHQKPSYRATAALALFLSGAKTMSDALIQTALGDSAKLVRDAALFALVRLRVENAKDVYLSYIDDADSYLQALALRGIGFVGDTTLAGVAGEFCDESDANLRSEAIATLGKLNCEESVDALAGLIIGEADERLLAQALTALGKFDAQNFRKLATNEIKPDNSLGLDMAIVSVMARALSGSRRDLLLDSLLRNGNSRLYEALFANLSEDLPPRSAQRYRESYARLANGPGLSTMFEYLRERDLYHLRWLSTMQLWDSLGADIDQVRKGVYLEHAAARREPWFFALALRLATEGFTADSPLKPAEREEVMRTLLSATENMLEELPGYEPNEQIRNEVKQVFETALQAPNFVVSRQAAHFLKKHFEIDRTSEITKPLSRYTVSEIAERLQSDPRNAGTLTLVFDDKTVIVELDYENAPLTCFRIVDLARAGFYNPVTFHRVIANFVTQGGDPRGDGWGGPDESMRCEYSSAKYLRGTVGIATSGKDTGGSQFFVTLSAQPHLEARYTIFGKVATDMSDIDNIRMGDQANAITVGPALQQ